VLVAVVSDTHMPRGARRLPGDCVARLERADLILHAGDVVQRSFLDELIALGPPVAAIHGNMDEPELQAKLPGERIVDAGEARFGMVHDPGPAAGRAARLVARFPGCDAVVYGHTHEPSIERHEGVWLLNPGSPTERRRSPQRAMLEVEVAGGELRPQLVELGP
jgi:putative phosphoesterase